MRGVVWGTGIEQSADGHRDRFDVELSYAIKAQVHLWAAVVTHKISETALDNLAAGGVDGPLHLDLESMLNTPMIGCLVCEQVYSPQLRRRKCGGEPS